MELFTLDPDAFEEELQNYDLRLREPIRAHPPNLTYRVKGGTKDGPLACGVIIGYGLAAPSGLALAGAPPTPVARMAFLIKPVRDKNGFALTQVVSDVPLVALQETFDTPELWYEKTYHMRHPLNWMDMLRVGTKQMLMKQQGAVLHGRVADVDAVAAEAGKES